MTFDPLLGRRLPVLSVQLQEVLHVDVGGPSFHRNTNMFTVVCTVNKPRPPQGDGFHGDCVLGVIWVGFLDAF